MRYFIRDGNIFSSDITEISIMKLPDDISINTNHDPTSCNRNIIEKLDKILKNKKKVRVSGLLEKVPQAEDLIISEIKDEIEFMEKTSQMDILEQLSKNLEGEQILEKYEKLLLKVAEENKVTQQAKISQLEEDISELDKRKKILRKEKSTLKDQMLTKNLERKDIEFDLKKRNEDILEIRKERPSILLAYYNRKSEKIRKKIKRLETNIKSINYEIEILQTRGDSLREKLKLGKKKNPHSAFLILTLGLSYYNRKSDIRYQLSHIAILINKNKEDIININQKITRLKTRLSILEDDILKKEEKRASRKKESEEKIKNLQKITHTLVEDLKKTNIEIEKISQKIGSKTKKERDLNTRIQNLKEKIKGHHTYSSEKLLEKFEKLKEQREKEKNEIKTLLERMRTQKINIKGNHIANLK